MAGLEGLLAGRTLVDRYRIEEVIGRGGFAAVYRATDERLGRTVAVKVITLGTSDAELREQIRRRFDREARAAAGLHHPNVVTVYDFGTDPELELDFLVMELLRGADLRAHLAGPEPLPLRVAVRVLRDAAWGLAAGHQVGLIHRDVKPANIFLAEQERAQRFRVCILDFGIAQIKSGEDSVTRLTKGPPPLSPAYASPEQLREDRELTPASDVFSLGVIGYQMLAGERPFGSHEIRAMGRGEMVPAPSLRERNPDVPDGVEAAIHRALAYAPEGRFSDARAMADALDTAYAGMRDAPAAASPPPPTVAPAAPAPAPPVAVAAPPAPEPAATPARSGPRRRFPISRLAMVLLLAAGALAAWWALSGDREPRRRVAQESPAARDTPSRSAQPGTQPGSQPQSAPPESVRAEGVAPGTGSGSAGAPATASPAPPQPATPAGTAASRTPPATVPPRRGAATRPVPSVPAASPRPAPPTATGAARLNQEGELLFERGNIPAAVDRFRRAVQAAPGSAYYRNNLGWALFQAGDLQGAARELAEVIRLDPGREIAHANLGEVRWAQGDTAGAIAAYERFLELNSDPRREQIAAGKLRRMRAAASGVTP